MKNFYFIVLLLTLFISATVILVKTVTNNHYEGEILAGTTTPYVAFTQNDYDQATMEGKVILLNFTTQGCASCHTEAQEAQAAFASLENPQVIGFQVNFKDEQTDADELALAKEFGVPYQHTKIILKDGKRVRKETVEWKREQFIEAILNAAN